MRLARRFAVPLFAAALATAVAHPAHADERSDARRHFRAGMQLIGDRHFNEGIAELQSAYAILPHPNVLYNIARAYYDAGDIDHAVEYLHRYLENDVPDRADVEAIVGRLEARQHERVGTQPAPTPTPTPIAPTNVPTTPIQLPTALAQGAAPGAADEYRRLGQLLVQLADSMQGHPASGAPTSSGAPSSGAPPTLATNASNAPPGPSVLPATPPVGRNAATGETLGAEPPAEEAAAYEEQVVTASRVAQSPLDAPNATSIITAQDIRLSGITNVALLLRRLVGIDVMMLDYSDVQVSARGFNQRLSNKMLVLIDGRSVYLDFLGVTLWPAVPVNIEDIERIEVIRGPGSALYGADAFTGVVNIITRAPGENRSQISFGGGNADWFRGAFFTSGLQGPIAYRASVSYEQAATFARPISATDQVHRLTAPDPDLGFRAPRFDLDLRTHLSRDTSLRGGVGVSSPTTWFSAIGPLRQFWSQLTFVQPYIQLDSGGFTARVFYNRFQADAEPLIQTVGTNPLFARVQQDVVDGDLQYAVRSRLGSFTNVLQVGASYRGKHISWNYLDADHFIHHLGLYLQDTLRHDRFEAVASGRFDYDSALSTPIFSPRGSLVFRPDEHRAIRLSGGTAFRTPTMLELYLNLTNATPLPGASAGATGGDVAMMPGNPIRPEQAVSVDLGYLDQSFLGSDRITFEANLYWTRAVDLLQLSPVALYQLPGGCPSPSSTMPQCTDTRISVGSGGFYNDPGATYVYGAEVSARISPIDGLDLYANYTLALTSHDGTALLNGGNGLPPDQRTPVHKFNVGVQVRTNVGFDLELFAYYVSSQVWLEQVFDPQVGIRYEAFNIGDYITMTGRIGYRMLHDRLDLGLVGMNLTDTNTASGHVEHPFGDRLSIRVMGTAAYRF